MATPVVAGSALLLRQYFVDGFYPSGALQRAVWMPLQCCLHRNSKPSSAASHVGPAPPLTCCLAPLALHCTAGARNPDNAFSPTGALVKAVMLGGAAAITGFEADTGLPVDWPPSFRQGFGRVFLGALLAAHGWRMLIVFDSRLALCCLAHCSP